MSYSRHIPHRANLDQFKSQAKELLRSFRQGEATAAELFRAFHPNSPVMTEAKLTDAQLVLARQHGQRNWKALVEAVRALPYFRQLLKSFEAGDPALAEQLVHDHPELLKRSDLLGRAVRHGNLEMVRLMHRLGATGVQDALGYIVYGDKRDIAQYLISQGASLADDNLLESLLVGACEVLNFSAFEMILDLWSRPLTSSTLRKCMAMVLSTYCRNPAHKHACIDRLISERMEIPDTPVMALHHGRVDLLEQHLKTDPNLFRRRYQESEIYPPLYGINPGDGLHLAPLEGAGLIHLAVEFDEREILSWLLDRGADPNLPTAIDADQFGGHTPLFHTTVSYTPHDDSKARILLAKGADPTCRATLRKQLRYMGQRHLERMYEFHDVTCVEFARQFQVQQWVSERSIELIDQKIKSDAG